MLLLRCFFFFFFNDTATTEIYTLSLHDALPIYAACPEQRADRGGPPPPGLPVGPARHRGGVGEVLDGMRGAAEQDPEIGDVQAEQHERVDPADAALPQDKHEVDERRYEADELHGGLPLEPDRRQLLG